MGGGRDTVDGDHTGRSTASHLHAHTRRAWDRTSGPEGNSLDGRHLWEERWFSLLNRRWDLPRQLLRRFCSWDRDVRFSSCWLGNERVDREINARRLNECRFNRRLFDKCWLKDRRVFQRLRRVQDLDLLPLASYRIGLRHHLPALHRQ